MNINSTSGSSSSSTDYSRITGLATGLDTDAMVKQAMSGDQVKIDKVRQDQQYLEWQQEAYVGVIKDLKDFSSTYLDILAPSDTSMMKSSAYSGVKAVVSANNNGDNKLSVSTNPGAIKGTYSVYIDQLASGAKQQTAISNLTDKANVGQIKITIGDTSNGSSNSFTLDTTSSMSKSDLINNLKKVVDKDGNSILNYVNINYSEITKKLTIETKTTGSNQTLNITDTSGLGIDTNGTVQGTDAKVRILAPGETTSPDQLSQITKSSNSFTIDNLVLNLQDTTTNGTVNDTSDDTPISVSVKADATDSIAKIKKFVDAYNTLIDKLNTKINEKKDLNYKPLTDDQKSAMKDSEITSWETKAKQGILSRESNITNLLFQMRQSIYDTVKGAGISISDIGISTTSDYKSAGKLEIDEDKLKSALENRSDQVQKLFIQSSTDSNSKGILQKFNDVFNQTIGSNGTLIKKAGYENTRWVVSNDLSKSIEVKKQMIANLQENFTAKQQRYYRMYATLESNMNKLNTQSSWLSSQLGSA